MRLLISVVLLAASILIACNSNSKSTAVPITVTMTEAAAKDCVHDTTCAELMLSYPVLSGGANPEAIKGINDSIMAFVYMVIGGDPKLPLPLAFDSAKINLATMLREQVASDPEFSMSFTNELKSKVAFQNAKYLSVEMTNYSFTGGAHGNYGTALNCFDLNTGKSVQLTDIVKDTAALRPLLEKGFVDAINKESGEVNKLEDLVFPESLPLPMPLQWCIVKEGIRCIYNPYEVAPYAVGIADILLTWEQLGPLATSKNWLE